MVTYGVDHIKQYKHWLADGRVALLTSATGRNSANESTISLLQEICHLTALFEPEHGLRGAHAAGDATENSVDPETGLPVYSLYNANSKHLSADMLEAFDILVFDIQDVGLRFYTFLTTLCYMLEDCAAAGKRLVVLDRPNPLGGEAVEGGLLREEYKSFVGCRPIPIRYALTLGEFAVMINQKEKLGCDLHIVPCDWHGEAFPQWEKIWQMPSLNLPAFENTALYAGTCLFEGTTLSEGRGTAAPFRIIGGPDIDAEKLVKAFAERRLPGAAATPVYFTPTTSKHQGTPCGGLMLHVTDFAALRPVELGVELVDLFQQMYPEQSQFIAKYSPTDLASISRLTGCGDFVSGWDKNAVLERWRQESALFAKEKADYHLYERQFV
ncbi:MAG: DUF1343 domain-containing protein [Clostridiales bacterium]|nr:DUF1343 domain-containing protein [Clostridiales bacterium]